MNTHLFILDFAILNKPVKETIQIIQNIVIEERLATRNEGSNHNNFLHELRNNLLNISEEKHLVYITYLGSYLEIITKNLELQENMIAKVCDFEKYSNRIFIQMAFDNKIKNINECKGFYANWFKSIRRDHFHFEDFIYDEFEIYSNLNNCLIETQNKSNIDKVKLKWRGQNNQLYSVLRQLKNDYELTDSSYDEIAEFIKQSFTGFENTKKGTIEKELKKKKLLPKPKRIPINLNKNELN